MVGFRSCACFIAILMFSFSAKALQGVDPCDDLKVEVKTKDSTNETGGEISVKILDGTHPVKVHVFGEGSRNNRLNAGNKIDNLKKGRYVIIIQDKAGCTKKLEANIK